MTDGEFFLNHRTLHDFIAVATEIVRNQSDVASKLRWLRIPFESLLNDAEWLPKEFRQPSASTTMGRGIASLLLYRSARKDLSLSTLVVAPGLVTPVHNHAFSLALKAPLAGGRPPPQRFPKDAPS
jgi:predicted metal-dependent enzyme (double-stranded beta helix superfamily)